jgi:hypothetical protein
MPCRSLRLTGSLTVLLIGLGTTLSAARLSRRRDIFGDPPTHWRIAATRYCVRPAR